MKYPLVGNSHANYIIIVSGRDVFKTDNIIKQKSDCIIEGSLFTGINSRMGCDISAVADFITANIEDVTRDGAAVYFGYDPSYFSSLIKKETGGSFTRLRLRIRLEKVTDLLSNHEMSISDIALSGGFKNTTYFYKAFKEAYGVTPHRYRLLMFPKRDSA